jgi:molybdopterin-guanine dinucleotide biosynthesis protein A
MKPLGVVLAGGASLRMGGDKALIEVAGRTMLTWVAAALRNVCDEVLMTGRVGVTEGLAGILDDLPGPRGPLAGIVTGLGVAAGRPLLAVAVDHPWIRLETLARLAESPKGALPVEAGVRQVTCACYPASLLEMARAELEQGGSVQSLLDREPLPEMGQDVWETWGEDGRSWWSVDDMTSLEEGLSRFGPPG